MRAPAGTVRFLGHSTVLIDLDATRILTDPLLGERLGPLRRRPRGTSDSFDLVTADAVLISHAHHDHLHLASLRRLAGSRLIVPRGLGQFLAREGHVVTEVEVGERVTIGALTIEATPARHHGRRRPFGPSSSAIGYRISGSSRLYFAGDTDLFPEMRDLAGGIDVALLPVWGWGPRLGPGHLDPARAAEAVARIRPRIAIPIHWGTFYPVGLARFWPHPLERPPLDFVAEVARVAPATEVRVLAPGELTALPSAG
jgi:L-ascorbate metabolism protein UlaG (beta-lactamase superfamily)